MKRIDQARKPGWLKAWLALCATLLLIGQPCVVFAHTQRMGEMNATFVDLAVTIDQGADSAPGGEVPFFIDVTNHGATPAANVVLTVTLTLNLLYRQSDLTPQSGPFPGETGQVVYALGALAAGEKRSLRLDTDVTDPARSATILDAAVTSAEDDAAPHDNVARVRFPLRNTDLTVLLSQESRSEAFAATSNYSYAIDLSNQGYQPSRGVLTLTVPAGSTFISAQDSAAAPVTPTINGNHLAFALGTLNPGDAQRLLVQVKLPGSITSGAVYTSTAQLAAEQSDDQPENNTSVWAQQALPDAANLVLSLDPWSEGEVGGKQEVRVNLANSGLRIAANSKLTVTLPVNLSQRTFSLPPTRQSATSAMWELGAIAGGDSRAPLVIGGVLSAAGAYTTTASVSTTTAESNFADNRATFVQPVVALLPPVITRPRWGDIAPLPIFVGTAKPNSLVRLYRGSTPQHAGAQLGEVVADAAGDWAIQVTQVITPAGWYWFTATQTINAVSSPAAAVANFVGEIPFVDPNSVTRNGNPVGGLNTASLGSMRRSSDQVLGMRIVECAPVYSPTLAIDYQNKDAVRLETVVFTPTALISTTGWVTFTIHLTGDNEAVASQLYLRYSCSATGGGDNGGGNGGGGDNGRNGGNHSGGFGGGGINPGGGFKHGNGGCILGCSPGGDDDDRGPGVAPGATGAENTPGGDEEPDNPGAIRPDGDLPCWVPGSKHKCEPVLIDPDGFIFDALRVRSGGFITQSLVTQAWVTLTVQLADGSFVEWPAQDFANQVNPQLSDAQYADHVVRLGYYAFFVPVGAYQVSVTAPGYQPYRSPLLRVIDHPITWHIGLERATLGKVAATSYPVLLPLIQR